MVNITWPQQAASTLYDFTQACLFDLAFWVSLLAYFCPCDVKSYEALFTALSEPSVSPDDPKTLNKVASLTM